MMMAITTGTTIIIIMIIMAFDDVMSAYYNHRRRHNVCMHAYICTLLYVATLWISIGTRNTEIEKKM